MFYVSARKQSTQDSNPGPKEVTNKFIHNNKLNVLISCACSDNLNSNSGSVYDESAMKSWITVRTATGILTEWLPPPSHVRLPNV